MFEQIQLQFNVIFIWSGWKIRCDKLHNIQGIQKIKLTQVSPKCSRNCTFYCSIRSILLISFHHCAWSKRKKWASGHSAALGSTINGPMQANDRHWAMAPCHRHSRRPNTRRRWGMRLVSKTAWNEGSKFTSKAYARYMENTRVVRTNDNEETKRSLSEISSKIDSFVQNIEKVFELWKCVVSNWFQATYWKCRQDTVNSEWAWKGVWHKSNSAQRPMQSNKWCIGNNHGVDKAATNKRNPQSRMSNWKRHVTKSKIIQKHL